MKNNLKIRLAERVKEKIALITTILVIVLLSFPIIHGLGISPVRKIYDYNPNIEGKARIINLEKHDIRVLVKPEGELSQYTTIKPAIIDLKAGESKEVVYKINAPQLEPGKHKVEITAIEIPKREDATITATLSVSQEVVVVSPYPDVYIEHRVAVSAPSYKQPTIFTIEASNLGSKVADVEAEISVKGPTNEELYHAISSKKKIMPGKSEQFSFSWKAKSPGNYYLESIVRTYGEKQVVTKKDRLFHIGGDEIRILGIKIGKFRLGGVIKLDVEVESNTNIELKGIYSEINISDERGSIIRIKTPTIDLSPFEKGILTGYWDTEGIEPGNYLFTVMVNYGIDRTIKTMNAYVGIDDIVFRNLKTGEAIAGTQRSNNYLGILIILIIVLIAANIYWIILIKKKIKS